MTGVLGALTFPPIAPAVLVSLTDRTISKSSRNDATVSYTISSNAQVRNQAGSVLEVWLLSGAASDYEVSVSSSGDELESGTTGSWLSCGSDQTWSLSNGNFDNSTQTASLTVSIRLASTGVVQDVANVTLNSESLSYR